MLVADFAAVHSSSRSPEPEAQRFKLNDPVTIRQRVRADPRRGERVIGNVRRGVVATIFVATAAVTACGAPARYPRANVLLITLDTLRADRLGAYGYKAAATPALDSLAADGVLFERAIAPVPLTLPSHTSIMTSRFPPQHGVRDNGAFDIAQDAAFVAEVFRNAGYDTGAFVGAYVLHSRWGLEPGFDTYSDNFEYGDASQVAGQVERRGDRVLEAAIPWLSRRRDVDQPFFAWVHLYDPHTPCSAPEPFASRHTDPYDAEVAFTDSLVGQLLETLERTRNATNTIVLVTADHGEGLGDHDEPGHGLFVYDTTQRVPMLLRLPDQREAGRRVQVQVPNRDVAPTLLEAAEIAIPAAFHGTSMMSLVDGSSSSGGDGNDGPRVAYSETYFPRFHFGWQELFALHADGMKLILAPRVELYDLESDPGERRNLALQQPAVVARMTEELEAIIGDAEAARPGQLDGDAAQRLRALGYIGGGVGGSEANPDAGPLPDPKDKLPLFRDLTQAQGFLQRGEAERAVEQLRRVIAEDDGVVDAHFTLGNALFKLRRYDEAEVAFRATMALSPEYDLALSNLGLTHLQQGRREQARQDFEALLALNPDSSSANYQLGDLALQDGRADDALRYFEAGLRGNSALPALHFGVGVARLQTGNTTGAREALERAAELAPTHPEVHYYRAQLAEARGDLAAASALYRRQVEVNPAHHRSLFNLSQSVARDGNHAEAADLLRAAVRANGDFAAGYLYLGRSLLALDDVALLGEAEEAARRGLALNPPAELRPLGHYLLADIYTRRGDGQAAQRELGRARAAEAASEQR